MLHARRIRSAIQIAENNKHITPELATELREKVRLADEKLHGGDADYRDVWRTLERHDSILQGHAREARRND